VVDKGNMLSNTNLDGANKTLFTSLNAKLTDPMTAEKAKPWNDKALIAKLNQKSLINTSKPLSGIEKGSWFKVG
jgi:hypothetical protein